MKKNKLVQYLKFFWNYYSYPIKATLEIDLVNANRKPIITITKEITFDFNPFYVIIGTDLEEKLKLRKLILSERKEILKKVAEDILKDHQAKEVVESVSGIYDAKLIRGVEWDLAYFEYKTIDLKKFKEMITDGAI